MPNIITNDSLSWAHPLVREWFKARVGQPTEPQKQGWPSIRKKKNTLISAPTGSGKTFAAFLVFIDQLIRKALDHTLSEKTEILYISPLKALSNDIQKNLLVPLGEITALAKAKGYACDEIRIAVRTGDTLSYERQKMLKKPPHILVTTPESFYILLTAEKSRSILNEINTVIVDEIHALANVKRGTHLLLSLERLEALTEKPCIRIGLSATQKPIDRIAKYLVGARPMPTIINIGYKRELDVAVEVPKSELGPVASNEMWDEVYDRLSEFINENRSTLIFVNTRKLAERVAHHLSLRIGEENVATHHGSLSRKLRLKAETKLKNGELKALVATASLELGIDIGNIDLVCQIGSPRAIAVALQRIGRSGHWYGATSKGRLFATTRDELVECAALVNAIHEGDLDQIIIPHEPLDILSQQIIAACSTNEWREEDLFHLVKKAYPYHHLSRESFNAIIEMLANGIAGSRGRYGAYLFRDQVNGIIRARRGSRITAITSGGAIPENGLFTVVAEPNGVTIGTLDEDFAVESNRGDIILLGTTSWQIRRVESSTGRVLVEDAHGAPPSVPFWRGEAPSRSIELSAQVANLRQKVCDMALTNVQAAKNWLKECCGLDEAGADQLVNYISQGFALLGAVPTQQTVIAERFFDEAGGMQLIIHAPFGARINKAWGLALRKKFCRSFNFELQAQATDDGLNISLSEQHSFPLADVFQFLHPNTIKETLVQAVLQSPLFNTRWRWDATRSLALVRFRYGRKVPPNIQRMLSDDLLAAVFPDAAACQDNLGGRDVELPDHPIINETMKDVLHEALDLEGFTQVLTQIANDEITCVSVDTPMPSPFSHEILNANPYAYLDDAPLEERRARAVEMRRVLPEHMLKEVGQLDAKAIIEVKEQVCPDIRNADELHDFLQTVIVNPEQNPFPQYENKNKEWQVFFDELLEKGRAGFIKLNDEIFWYAIEKQSFLQFIYPEAQFFYPISTIEKPANSAESAIESLLRGWLLHLGPITSQELSEFLKLSTSVIDAILIKIESSGFVLRGNFRDLPNKEMEWCERRLLARIHRLTKGSLRKAIQPITCAQFMVWLLRFQHLAPNTQLQGEHGLLEIIRQLQGFEIPANAWERKIFAKRLKDYTEDKLNQLCLTGRVAWGRLSPHPALINADKSQEDRKKRVFPTSTAPITFYVRGEEDWMPISQQIKTEDELPGLSHIAKSIYQFLKNRGASFFADIVRGVNHLKSEVEMGLWELVTSGLITSDGFDNLRALIDPHRRLDRKRRQLRTRHSIGRWAIIYPHESIEPDKQTEAICWMLLKRYGVVFRDLLVREKNLPRWRDLLIMFRRLEDRGEIRGGRFVSGFLGEQFALPFAVDSLRAMKNKEVTKELVTVASVDPLNLVGILLPGAKISAQTNQSFHLQDGEFCK